MPLFGIIQDTIYLHCDTQEAGIDLRFTLWWWWDFCLCGITRYDTGRANNAYYRIMRTYRALLCTTEELKTDCYIWF